MINQNKGKQYNPTPVYCRRILRNIAKNHMKKVGFTRVNRGMSLHWRQYI